MSPTSTAARPPLPTFAPQDAGAFQGSDFQATGLQDGPAAENAAAEVSALEQWFESLGWIDRSALAVLLLFFVIGLFRGLRWQISRILVLLAAYTTTMVAAPFVAGPLAEALDRKTHGLIDTSGLPMYLASIAVFLGALVILAILSRLVRRAHLEEELERPTFGSRVSGAGLGVLTGALVLLGVVSGVHLVAASTGIGSGLVEAAEQSHVRGFGERAVGIAAGALPDDLRGGAEAWHELLRDGLPEPTSGGADSGSGDDWEGTEFGLGERGPDPLPGDSGERRE